MNVRGQARRLSPPRPGKSAAGDAWPSMLSARRQSCVPAPTPLTRETYRSRSRTRPFGQLSTRSYRSRCPTRLTHSNAQSADQTCVPVRDTRRTFAARVRGSRPPRTGEPLRSTTRACREGASGNTSQLARSTPVTSATSREWHVARGRHGSAESSFSPCLPNSPGRRNACVGRATRGCRRLRGSPLITRERPHAQSLDSRG